MLDPPSQKLKLVLGSHSIFQTVQKSGHWTKNPFHPRTQDQGQSHRNCVGVWCHERGVKTSHIDKEKDKRKCPLPAFVCIHICVHMAG